MAPIGFDMSDDLDDLTQSNVVAAAPSKAPATILVVSCQDAAADGSYQSLVSQLSSKGQVEMHMFDRIVEAATSLTPSQFQHVSILLPPTLITSSLLALIEPSLAPGGILEVRGEEAASAESVASELKLIGLTGVANQDPSVLLSSKPLSSASSAPVSLKRPQAEESTSSTTSTPAAAIALPLRSSRAAKASLWAFTSSSTNGTATPTIDESTLLTPEDLERPTLVKRDDCEVKKTRKACKNCSCGLRELLLQERDDLGAVGFQEGATGAVGDGGTQGVKAIGANVTSSCGSCYLGDAFRCASCPYLGMPAFDPGQKVTISGHDDKIIT